MVVAGIRSLLQEIDYVRIVGCCNDGQSARQLLELHRADVLMLDINLPDISGIDFCLELKKKYPLMHILGISNYNEKSMISKILENGASGYLLKNATSQELRQAIDDAIDGRLFFSNDVAKKMLNTPGNNPALPQLTRREKEILKLIADGNTSSMIAESLFISQLTVETHRRHIVQKFVVPNMTSVIKLAIDYGIL